MNRNIDFTVGPYQLALDITNKCNLRCLHCYNASGENRVIIVAQLSRQKSKIFIMN